MLHLNNFKDIKKLVKLIMPILAKKARVVPAIKSELISIGFKEMSIGTGKNVQISSKQIKLIAISNKNNCTKSQYLKEGVYLCIGLANTQIGKGQLYRAMVAKTTISPDTLNAIKDIISTTEKNIANLKINDSQVQQLIKFISVNLNLLKILIEIH